MTTTTHEIAPDVFKIRTEIPDDGDGFTFNQFLIRADQPLLVHTGPKQLFPVVLDALAKLVKPSDLDWIVPGHFEDDEVGALNLWLEAAPTAQCACLSLIVQAGIGGFADRPPAVLGDQDADIDLGSHYVRLFATPHFPHAWEAQMLYERTTQTLFCGDLGAQVGMPPPIDDGIALEQAIKTELMFESTNVSPVTIQTLRWLQTMPVRTLAIMHGASIKEDVPGTLQRLHDFYLQRLNAQFTSLQVPNG